MTRLQNCEICASTMRSVAEKISHISLVIYHVRYIVPFITLVIYRHHKIEKILASLASFTCALNVVTIEQVRYNFIDFSSWTRDAAKVTTFRRNIEI